jgi:hypothetical protein
VTNADDRRVYVIDTSALIRAWQEAYPRRRFESLWARLESELLPSGRFLVPKVVEAEIGVLSKDLRAWLTRHKKTCIVVQADPFVIAVAHGLKATVVTEEGGKKCTASA